MNKQIEELAKAIHLNCNAGLFEDEAKMIAEFVINKQGYRKTSDVVKEIFAEIENNSYSYGINFVINKETLAELKKKYEVTEDES
jgi:hypothetical protein